MLDRIEELIDSRADHGVSADLINNPPNRTGEDQLGLIRGPDEDSV